MSEKVKAEIKMLELNKKAILSVEEGKRIFGFHVLLKQIEKRILELELLS